MNQQHKFLIILIILSFMTSFCSMGFAQPSTPVAETKKNLLVIGALDDYPIMFADQEGAPSGLAVDVLNGYAERMGYTLSYELYPSKQIDAVFQTKGDLKYASFELDRPTDFESTLSFYYKNYALFTNDKNMASDLSRASLDSYIHYLHKNKATLAYKDNNSLEKNFSQKYTDIHFTAYEKYSDLVNSLKEEKRIYALIPNELGRKLIDEHNLKELTEIQQTLYIEEASFELSKSNIRLLYSFNRYISDIKEDNTLNLLTEKWFEHKLPQKHNNRFLFYFNIFGVLSIFAVLALGYKNIIMQKVIEEKTAEIIEKTQSNERLYQRLLKEEQYKNNYFINLSHDLRTPISLILNASQMSETTLKSLPDPSRQKTSKYLNIISSNSYRLLKMISNLIDLNRLSSDEFKLKLESFDFVMALEKVVHESIEGGYIQPDSIHIEANPSEVLVEADVYELSRIFATLIANSVKYSESQPEIHLNIQVDAQQTQIIYEDYHLKISSEILEQLIHNPYYQSDTLNKDFEGLSIDLYLVKCLTELHHAHMKVDAQTEHARFIFSFDHLSGVHPVSSDYPKINYDLKQLVKMTFADASQRSKQTKQVCS